MKPLKSRFALCLIPILWMTLSLGLLTLPKDSHSLSERRPLALFPTLSLKSLTEERYFSALETYLQDHFPLRETFREGKALFRRHVLRQGEVNGLFHGAGHMAAVVHPYNDAAWRHAMAHFQTLHGHYLEGSAGRIHFAVIPDKSHYLQDQGALSLNLDEILPGFQAGLPFAAFTDLHPLLTLEHYYTTDPHWRQETLRPVADALLAALGKPPTTLSYHPSLSPHPFLGAYAGQSALPLPPDTLTYLTHPLLEEVEVRHLHTESPGTLYDLEKLSGRDPYEVFLSGALPLLTLENPNANTKDKLLLFRDSFGSALAPLLLEHYAAITLIDTRYIHSALLGDWVDFHGQDVLLLYSTLLLNQSASLR